MKKITIVLLLLSTLSAVAMGPGSNVFAHNNFDKKSQRPDARFQSLGIKAYQTGAFKRALKNFKKSAKLGNNKSKYLTALVYLEQKDFINSYAWLQLLEEPVDQSEILLDRFSTLLNEQEKISATVEFNQLAAEYSKKNNNKPSNQYVNKVKTAQ